MVAIKKKIVVIERRLSYEKREPQKNGSTIFPKLLIQMRQLQKKKQDGIGDNLFQEKEYPDRLL